MSKIDATELTVTLPASVRLRAFKRMLADYQGRLALNPMDEEAAFGVRVFQRVVDELREEVKDEWPDYITE